MKRLCILLIVILCGSFSCCLAQTGLSLTSDKQKGCKPEVITFTCSGVPAGSSYAWIIGTDKKSGKSKISYTFSSAGVYDVSVTATFPNGTTHSVSKKSFIRIGEAPSMSKISVTRNYLCSKDTATFTLKGVKAIEWDWIIEGVNYAMKTPSITHRFGSNGYQDISLRIKDSLGCTAIKTADSILFVATPPAADFSASRTDGCVPLKTVFTADSSYGSSPVSSYTWSFPGGTPSSSNKAHPDTVLYTHDSTYDVSLTIKTKDGCSYNALHKSYIKAGKGLKITFSADTTKGMVGDTFKLTSKILSGAASSSGRYSWSTGGTIIGSGTAIKTTYIHPGVYAVNLLYYDRGCGFQAYRAKYIKVYSSKKDTGSSPSYKGCGSVSASFAIPGAGCVGNKIALKVPNPIQAFHCKWQADSPGAVFFPSDTSRNPQIIFSRARKYSVTLTTRQDTCTASYSASINILQSKLDFTSNDTLTACQPAYVTFYTSSENVDTFFWDFGDGSKLVTTSGHVGHIYTQNSGDSSEGFTVSIYGKNKYGCTVSRTREKYVKVIGPRAAFSIIGPHKALDSIRLTFKDLSSNIQNYQFDYGDNSVADVNTIRPHVYVLSDTNAVFQVFHPKMVVKNTNGCSMIAQSDSVVVYRAPKARFKVSITPSCGTWNVQFQNLSRYASSWKWDFENKGKFSDSGFAPAHSYKPGIYTVRLIAFNKYGTDTFIAKDIIKINNIASAVMQLSSSSACPGTPVTVSATNITGDVQSLKWVFDKDARASDTGKSIVHSFHKAGTHTIFLITTNKNGCTDTSGIANLYLYDTSVGISPLIKYVSVQDKGILVVWKKLPATQAIRYSLYRDNRLIYESQNTDDTSYSDNDSLSVNNATYNYRLQVATMACGSGAQTSISHASILLNGFYDSTALGNKLAWNNYTGWNVKEYHIYRSHRGGRYELIATTQAGNTSYLDTRICSDDYEYYVLAASADNLYSSQSNKTTLHDGTRGKNPEYIQLNYVTVGDNRAIIIEWQPSRIPGVYNYIIDRFTESTGWQEGYAYTKNTVWKDENVEVMQDAYEYRIRVQDACGNITLHSNAGRSILLNAKMEGDKIKLDWNKSDSKGIIGKNYFVQLKTAPDRYMTLPHLPQDTSYLDEADHSAMNGAVCYRVMAFGENKPDTSASNISCVVLPSRLFIPNAFTPNNDGLNDEFKVDAISMYQLTGNQDIDYHMRIYDRWGNEVFESTDINKGWNGEDAGKPAIEGVYTYSIYSIGKDREHYHVQGTVVLLR